MSSVGRWSVVASKGKRSHFQRDENNDCFIVRRSSRVESS